MKKLLVLLCPFILTACLAEMITVGYVVKEQYYEYFSNAFDATEYSHLVKLNVAASRHSCNPRITNDMRYHSDFLVSWSRHRNNANIHKTYIEVASLANELYNRVNPSKAYCDLKTQTIDRITKRILKVYGTRR